MKQLVMPEIMLSNIETSMYWPRPVLSRDRRAIKIPIMANMPALTSATE